jgi:ring-1,2-phenylacetyl-CoA epoxidase subunit PaaD
VNRLEAARAAAGTVTDPELPMLTLADLGVLEDVRLEGEGVVVTLVPTYSGCPGLAEMRAGLVRALSRAGFAQVDVRISLTPVWTTARITEHGRDVLRQHGIAPPAPHSGPVDLAAPRHTVPCPRCGSHDTRVQSWFGPTGCTSLHVCQSCREPFEHVKARG